MNVLFKVLKESSRWMLCALKIAREKECAKKSPEIPWYLGKGLYLLTHRQHSKYLKKVRN